MQEKLKIGQIFISSYDDFISPFQNKKIEILRITEDKVEVKWFCDYEMNDYLKKFPYESDIDTYHIRAFLKRFISVRNENLKCRKI
jgi:hypothetical protein